MYCGLSVVQTAFGFYSVLSWFLFALSDFSAAPVSVNEALTSFGELETKEKSWIIAQKRCKLATKLSRAAHCVDFVAAPKSTQMSVLHVQCSVSHLFSARMFLSPF